MQKKNVRYQYDEVMEMDLDFADSVTDSDDGSSDETEEMVEALDDDDAAAPTDSFGRPDIVTAYYRCRNDLGEIDLGYIRTMTGRSKKAIIEALEGVYMWEDPDSGAWVTREQMARHNVRKKLATAEAVYQKTGRLWETVKLLRSLVPAEPFAEEVEFSLSSRWIPIYFKLQFIRDLTLMSTEPKYEYDEYHGTYKIIPGGIPNPFNNHYVYGTDRMTAVELAEKDINCKPLRNPDEKDAKNEIFPELEKLQLIREAFVDWVRKHPETEERLMELYAEINGYAVVHYDGSHREPEGLNPEVTLYPRQKDAIEGIVACGGNYLIAHEAGAGKTYVFLVGVKELLRIGIVKKALVVVPNNVLGDTVKAYQYLYPGHDCLAVFPKDFTPKYREQVLKQLASDRHQVVFMAYSTLELISMSRAYHIGRLENEIRRLSAMIANTRSARLRRTYERARDHLSRDLVDKLGETDTKEQCFDSLGFDCMVVDESHNYKNITLGYEAENVIGFHAKGSRKNDELSEMVRFITKGGGRVIFSSGTPVPNSLADIYVNQQYLQEHDLEALGIRKFSEWMATFCKEESQFEVDANQKALMVRRISEFCNLPELSAMFSNVCDYYRIDPKELNLPDQVEEEVVMVEITEAVRDYMEYLALRAEDVHAGVVSRREDNLLKITTDGRLCSVDIRLVDPKAAVQPHEGKMAKCTEKILEMYHKYPGKTQIVFSDIGTPKVGFNVYDEMKKLMTDGGIRENEIAFIHDASTEKQREKLIAAFNRGDIRVMIGSTRKLGTGCNVQENLVAIHNLDVPWKPSDLEQRRRRIVRQGNSNQRVHVFYYLMRGTFDAYSYQKLESKERFITKFFSGTLSGDHRKETDIADTVLKYAEIKAAAIGNPLIKRRVELTNELDRAKMARGHRALELQKIQALIGRMPSRIKECRARAEQFDADSRYYKEHKASISREDRIAFGEELAWALDRNGFRETERFFDEYQGFQVFLPKRMRDDERYVFVTRENGGRYRLDVKTDKAVGCSMRLDRLLEKLEDRAKEQREQAEAYRQQLADAQKEIERGNPHLARMEELIREIEAVDEQLKEAEHE